MKNSLAVITIKTGLPSETFIQRHIEELFPSRTVVASLYGYGKDAVWRTESPHLILDPAATTSFGRMSNRVLKRINLYETLQHRKLIKFLQSHSANVILCEYLHISTRYVELAKKMNIRFVAHAHGYDVSQKLKNEYWRKKYLLLNNATAVVTMSQYSKDVLIDLGIKEDKLHVIPYGIHLPTLDYSPSVDRSTINCMAVGRMVAKKAPLLLLESFRTATLQNPMLVLHYVGSGHLYESAIEYTKEHRLNNKVFFHGALPNDQVLNLMREADMFVQHSVTCSDGDQEGMPVAILEAMGACLPVISTLHAGIPEAVIDGETGFLVPERDTKLMAQKILQLANDKHLRIQMGKAGRRRAELYFTWEKERRSLMNLLNLDNE